MTTTYTVTRDQVINAALRVQGVLDYNQTADATKVTFMAEAFNMMVKRWAASEIKLWTVEEIIIPTTTAGKLNWTLGPSGADITCNRPLRIIEAFFRTINGTSYNDFTLQPLSRQEYLNLGDKASQGVPNSFYYTPNLPNGIVYVYVSPDASEATNEIHLWSQRQILDLNNSTDTPDFPQEWFEALKWGLADATALENQCPLDVTALIAQRAERYKSELENWDQEWSSIYLQPDMMRTDPRAFRDS